MVNVWHTRASKTTLYPSGPRPPLWLISDYAIPVFQHSERHPPLILKTAGKSCGTLQLKHPSSVLEWHKPGLTQIRTPVRREVQFYHLQALSHLEGWLLLNPRAVRSAWFPLAHDHTIPFTSAPSSPAVQHCLARLLAHPFRAFLTPDSCSVGLPQGSQCHYVSVSVINPVGATWKEDTSHHPRHLWPLTNDVIPKPGFPLI